MPQCEERHDASSMLYRQVYIAGVIASSSGQLSNRADEEQKICVFSTESRATMQCEQHTRFSFHPVCRRRETDSQWGARPPSISNAKDNALFCVTAGTTVTWKNTGKNIGFVVDPGTRSPCEPEGAIIGGSDRSLSVVAKTAGCCRYSAGACTSGVIYGMCKEISAEVIVTGGN